MPTASRSFPMTLLGKTKMVLCKAQVTSVSASLFSSLEFRKGKSRDQFEKSRMVPYKAEVTNVSASLFSSLEFKIMKSRD